MVSKPRVAVVTGASSGIGLAVAEQLFIGGWFVYALSRREPRLSSAPPAVRGGGFRHLRVDLAEAESVADVLAALDEADSACNALIHCAGIVERGSFTAVGVAGLQRQFDVNVRAPYALTAALLPRLSSASGDVVFVNSTQGLTAGADAVAYAATKHALKAIADGLRSELSGSDVRVCSVYPGRTDTQGQRQIFHYEGRDYTPDQLVKPGTVASLIVQAVELSGEAELIDLTVRPSRRG